MVHAGGKRVTQVSFGRTIWVLNSAKKQLVEAHAGDLSQPFIPPVLPHLSMLGIKYKGSLGLNYKKSFAILECVLDKMYENHKQKSALAECSS